MRRLLSLRGLVVGGLLAALVVVVLASMYASGAPDGLNRVAADEGIAAQEESHDLDGSPLAGYETSGVDDSVSGGVAGAVGIAATFVIGAGLFLAVRRRGGDPARTAPDRSP